MMLMTMQSNSQTSSSSSHVQHDANIYKRKKMIESGSSQANDSGIDTETDTDSDKENTNVNGNVNVNVNGNVNVISSSREQGRGFESPHTLQSNGDGVDVGVNKVIQTSQCQCHGVGVNESRNERSCLYFNLSIIETQEMSMSTQIEVALSLSILYSANV